MERTVLIVDDDDLLREAIAHDFQRKKYRVLLASNGTEAFEIANKEKIDIVLSDVRMPHGDGVELLRKIRNLHNETPVVFLITGFTDLSVEDAYHHGAAAVIAKPFDRKTLYDAVDFVLLPKTQRWDHPSNVAYRTLDVQLALPNLAESINGRVVNFGHGGMFVELPDNAELPLGTEVQFRISFRGAADSRFSGRGTLRWIRTQRLSDLPKGCGIEFTHIDEDFRDQIIEITAQLKTKSYIPKY